MAFLQGLFNLGLQSLIYPLILSSRQNLVWWLIVSLVFDTTFPEHQMVSSIKAHY